jgi:hypothetical protein
MLSNIANGTRLYMESEYGQRLEVITMSRVNNKPVFTVTPDTCRFPGRDNITLHHLQGFYYKYVEPSHFSWDDPLALLFLLEGPRADTSLRTLENERLGIVDSDTEEDEDEDEDEDRPNPNAMRDYMEAVAACVMKREAEAEPIAIRPCREMVEDSEDDEGIPRTYPRYVDRLRHFNDSLPVYVQLPGAIMWRAELFKGKFYVQGVLDGVNEWHLVNSYRKRFQVGGLSSTEGLQAIYVESGLHKDRSLAELLLELTDEELATVGSTPVPMPIQAMEEPPAPGAIAAALARIEAKEQALLAELAELDKVQAAMARVAALEARVVIARNALKDIM